METATKIAIVKAIEGGYRFCYYDTFFGQPYGKSTPEALYYGSDENGSYELLSYEKVLLDPLFWKALGRAEDWDIFGYITIGQEESNTAAPNSWLDYWIRFTHHIAQGKSIDDFFNKTLK